jgi:hypothetical protein
VEEIHFPMPEVAAPLGVTLLGQRIAAEAKALRVPRKALRVMAQQNDPYAIDTPANHLVGRWFAKAAERVVEAERSIQLRGLRYLLSTAAIVRPTAAPTGEYLTLGTRFGGGSRHRSHHRQPRR